MKKNSGTVLELSAPAAEALAAGKAKGSLTPKEQARFKTCEGVIQSHFDSYRTAGEALTEIRDGRFYRESYATFAEYCTAKWSMTKTQANRLIAAARAAHEMKTDLPGVAERVDHLSEAAMRPLTMLDRKTRLKVIKKAVRTAPTSTGITARLITDLAKEVAPDVFARRKVTAATGRRGVGGASSPQGGDLVRRSEVMEAITGWENARKKDGTLDTMAPIAVVRAIRAVIAKL